MLAARLGIGICRQAAGRHQQCNEQRTHFRLLDPFNDRN
jgi:hypothetical protein